MVAEVSDVGRLRELGWKMILQIHDEVLTHSRGDNPLHAD
jgi:hypothetical protein